jgi:CDGSH-type Zn-finger protein
MAIASTRKTRFEPIVIEIDGKTVEICSCGQTKNEDRTCDQTHNELNAQMDAEESGNDNKTMTVEEVLNKLNEEQISGNHECACGGSCGCGGH